MGDQERWELMVAKAKSFLRDLVGGDVVKTLVELMEEMFERSSLDERNLKGPIREQTTTRRNQAEVNCASKRKKKRSECLVA